MTKISTLTAYIKAQPLASRRALQQVREIILAAVPDAEELISYKMPAYRMHGRIALYFAGWSQHFAIYPASDALIAAMQGKLGPGSLKGRTFQFPFDRPVPVTVVRRIAKLRAKEMAELPPKASRKTQSKRKSRS